MKSKIYIGILGILLLIPIVYAINGNGGTETVEVSPDGIMPGDTFKVTTWAFQSQRGGSMKVRIWLEYNEDTQDWDESDYGTQITNDCGDKAFRVVNGPYKPNYF